MWWRVRKRVAVTGWRKEEGEGEIRKKYNGEGASYDCMDKMNLTD